MEVKQEKFCPRCTQTLAVKDNFAVSESGRVQSHCKPCRREYKRERYKNKPDARQKALEAAAKWKENNPERYEQNQARYRTENREELNEQAKEYRLENSEVIKEKDRTRSRTDEHRKRQREYHKLRYNSDLVYREKCKKRTKKLYVKWYNDNSERIKAVARIRSSKRRAVKYNATLEGFDESTHIQSLLEWQEGRCYYCNIQFEKYHLEHIVPLIKNGLHNGDNLVLSCQFCNFSKHDKLLYKEWNIKLETVDTYYKIDDLVINLSTFFLSERNSIDCKKIINDLKEKYPNHLLLFDYEIRHRQSAISNILSSRSGTAERIFARKTEIQVITPELARNFLNEYHLQGFGRGSIYLGLIYGEELVGVTAWLDINGAYELNRLAFKGAVIGGFSKMLKAFREQHMPEKKPIISFVDPRYANGHSYEKLGFKHVSNSGSPSYFYVNGAGLYNRQLFMKGRMITQLNYFDPSLTEVENAKVNGLFRVFGLKQKKYILD